MLARSARSKRTKGGLKFLPYSSGFGSTGDGAIHEAHQVRAAIVVGHERGDVSGHDFHGNQYTGGIGGGENPDRIPPVSGEGKKASISADLTTKALPSAVQTKVEAAFGRLGVTPQQAHDNLVNMFNSAPQQLRDEYRSWYTTEAKAFNDQIAAHYGLDQRVVAAITAANSPGGPDEARPDDGRHIRGKATLAYD